MFDCISKAIALTLTEEADYPPDDVSYLDMDTKQVTNNANRMNRTEVPFSFYQQQMDTPRMHISYNGEATTGVLPGNACNWNVDTPPVINNANRMNCTEVPCLFYQQQMGTSQMLRSYNGGATTDVLDGNAYNWNVDTPPVIKNANRMKCTVPFSFYQQQMGTPQMLRSYNGEATTDVLDGNAYNWNVGTPPVINNANRMKCTVPFSFYQQQMGTPQMLRSYNGEATTDVLDANAYNWNVGTPPVINNANRMNCTEVPFSFYQQQMDTPQMHRSYNGEATTGVLAGNACNWNVGTPPVINNANRMNGTEVQFEQKQMGQPGMCCSEAISYNGGTTTGVLAKNDYHWNVDTPPAVSDVNRMNRTEASTKTPLIEQTGGTAKLFENHPNMDATATPMNHILRNVNADRRSCDDAKMIVQTSNSKQAKRLCCLYCKETFPSLARHLQNVHKDETEVKLFAGLLKGSKERRNILDALRKKGTYEWNMNSHLNKGLLLTSRRPHPNQSNKAFGFTSCMMCLGSYKKTSIRHHVKNCTGNAIKGDRCVLVLGRAVEGRIHENASNNLQKLFNTFKVDDVVLTIRFDWLIIVYGNMLTTKYWKLKHRNMNRSKLRRAGQLLIEMRKICTVVSDLASIFQPKCYDSFVAAVRKIGRLDPITNYYGAPSTAAATVTETKEIASILECEYIKQEKNDKQIQVEKFLKLVKVDAGASIYKAVYETQAKMQRERKERLPSTADIKLFSEYLNQERIIYYNHLSQQFSFSHWLRLSELTLVSIMVFNRRRVGETQNILSTDFDGRDFLGEEEVSHLSDTDKIAAKKYSRMVIQGKKGRNVPALIKPHIEKCLNLVKSYRKEANIPDENEFLFALPPRLANRIRIIDACKTVHKFSIECGAKDPETLRGTTLRKHMASVCIWNESDDNTVAEVADFMGHEEKIHRLHYRRNPMVRQIVKMSKLLEQAQGNCDDADSNDPEPEYLENVIAEPVEPPVPVVDFMGDEEKIHRLHYRRNPMVRQPEYLENVIAEPIEPPVVMPTAKPNRKRKSDVTVSEFQGNGNDPELNLKIKRQRWTVEEIAAVEMTFPTYLLNKTLPPLPVIAQEKQNNESLRDRTPTQIKSWISNKYKKMN